MGPQMLAGFHFFFTFRPSESASGAFSDHLGMTNVITTWQDLTPKN